MHWPCDRIQLLFCFLKNNNNNIEKKYVTMLHPNWNWAFGILPYVSIGSPHATYGRRFCPIQRANVLFTWFHLFDVNTHTQTHARWHTRQNDKIKRNIFSILDLITRRIRLFIYFLFFVCLHQMLSLFPPKHFCGTFMFYRHAYLCVLRVEASERWKKKEENNLDRFVFAQVNGYCRNAEEICQQTRVMITNRTSQRNFRAEFNNKWPEWCFQCAHFSVSFLVDFDLTEAPTTHHLLRWNGAFFLSLLFFSIQCRRSFVHKRRREYNNNFDAEFLPSLFCSLGF